MKKIIWIGRAFWKEKNKKDLGAYAASTSFFMFLSLIPMLLVLCAIIPYTPLKQGDLLLVLKDFLPETLYPVAVSIVMEMYAKSVGVVSIAILVTIWSAGKGLMALIRGLNAINEIEEERGYVRLRIAAGVYTVIFLVVMVVVLIVLVFGQTIVDNIAEHFEALGYLIAFLKGRRAIYVIAALTAFFTTILSWIPGKRMPWREQIPGAIIVSIGWAGYSWLFSIYVDRFAGFGMYGSVSTVAAVMFWTYICMYILLIGSLTNRFLSPVYRYLYLKWKERREQKEKISEKETKKKKRKQENG